MTVFGFVPARKAEHSIKLVCRVLEVPRSGYHAWAARSPSPRAVEAARLTARICELDTLRRKVYGSPRIWADLVIDDGERIGRKRVERLMRQAGWSMADHMRTELVSDALQMALARRRPESLSFGNKATATRMSALMDRCRSIVGNY